MSKEIGVRWRAGEKIIKRERQGRLAVRDLMPPKVKLNPKRNTARTEKHNKRGSW